MPLSILPFLLLGLAFLSLWVRRDPKIWGSLLVLSVAAGLAEGNISWVAVLIVIAWAALWILYVNSLKHSIRVLLFCSLVLGVYGFIFPIFPGFYPLKITSHFSLGLHSLICLFPLALLVPLAKMGEEWKEVLIKGSWLIVVGIAFLALLAMLSGSVQWKYKIPSHAAVRYLSNFVLVAVPEEGFFRGFVQRELSTRFLKNTKKGKMLALVITSLIFAAAHLYWSPSLAILGFTFLAGLLYGGVYLISGRIESAILCHFLLNFIHMTFFSYHAM